MGSSGIGSGLVCGNLGFGSLLGSKILLSRGQKVLRLLQSHQVLKVHVAGICSNLGQRAGNVSVSLGRGECDFSGLACRSGILENHFEGSLHLSVLGSSELRLGSSFGGSDGLGSGFGSGGVLRIS